MEQKRKRISVVLGIIFIILIIVQFFYNYTNQKKIKNLVSNIEELKDKLEVSRKHEIELEEKISELEDNHSEVKHFDNNFDNYNSKELTFTGSAIESQIDGDFNGWDGETIFKLTNGTIWQQASYDYTYDYAFRPNVIIYKKGGDFYMQVEDVDEVIKVIQIK